ncbi:MAG: FtsQ-type POTRA domain-containing protein [Acidobacteria bacterium]|nr:FtsQ-type POTRA domain-containing protein [Acidobacteriota bacterium]
MTPGLPAPADKRFRRAQVKPTGRRGLWLRRAVVVAKSGGLALVVGLALWRAVTLVAESPALRIAHIVLHGNDRLSRGEAMALVGDLHGQNILAVRLEDWRQRLMTSPWVEDAIVRRVLPNTLDVLVRERTPMGVARLGRDLYLVDATGVVIDEYGPGYADLDLPVIDGLGPPPGEGAPVMDERRTQLVARLLADVAPHEQLAARVSQIDVRDARDAVVLLDGDTVLLRLGDRDFATRLQDYLDVATALKDRVTPIDTVDLRFGERMYVRPGRDEGGAQPASRELGLGGRVGGQ